MYASMYVCMYVCTHVCTYVCMYVCLRMHVCTLYKLVYIWVCVCILQCMSRYDSMCITCVYDIYIYRERERGRDREREREIMCMISCAYCAHLHPYMCVITWNILMSGSVSRGGANFLKDLPVGNPCIVQSTSSNRHGLLSASNRGTSSRQTAAHSAGASTAKHLNKFSYIYIYYKYIMNITL